MTDMGRLDEAEQPERREYRLKHQGSPLGGDGYQLHLVIIRREDFDRINKEIWDAADRIAELEAERDQMKRELMTAVQSLAEERETDPEIVLETVVEHCKDSKAMFDELVELRTERDRLREALEKIDHDMRLAEASVVFIDSWLRKEIDIPTALRHNHDAHMQLEVAIKRVAALAKKGGERGVADDPRDYPELEERP